MRIKSVHLIAWDKRTQGSDLNTFRALFDGTTKLAGRNQRVGANRLLEVLDLRVLPSVSALPAGTDRPSFRYAGSHAMRKGGDRCSVDAGGVR